MRYCAIWYNLPAVVGVRDGYAVWCVANADCGSDVEHTEEVCVRAFRLMSIADIDVRVHPTFGLVVLWFAYLWGVRTGAGLPGVFFGLAMVVCFFACVLLHELGHGLVARRAGLRVFDITLLPIGGVAHMERAPIRPGTELWLTFAGPLVNVVIVAVLLPVVGIAALAHDVADVGGVIAALGDVTPLGFVAYLMFANVSLVLFNLLPAFPMDGGRILRATLALAMPFATATQIAVGIGKGMAVLFAGVGIIILQEWTLPLVGVFVFIGAHMEGRVVALEESLRRMHVGQCIIWEAGGIAPHEPLSIALRGGPRNLAVTERGRVVGVLWKTDVLYALQRHGPQVKVYEVMDPSPPLVDVDTSLYHAGQVMARAEHPAVLVTQRGIYRGVLTAERYWKLYREVQRGRREKGTERYWGWFLGWARQWRREKKVLSAIGRKSIS